MASLARGAVTLPQLPLPLRVADYARFETFVPGANTAAVEHLRAIASGARDFVFVSGPAASGKTHLLQAACRAAALEGRRAMYLALDEEHASDPAILTGLEEVELLALDRVDRVAGAPEWERRLFVLINELARRGGLAFAARPAAGACGFALPDLASRAAAAVGYRLQPLEDADRVAALRAHAAARGLELDRAAAEYLLHRVDRDFVELGRWLERLDRASLAEQRRLTIPFIRGLLGAERPAG